MEIIRRKTAEAKEFFFENYKKGDLINVKKTAESLGVSRPILIGWMKEINEEA
tara:strand:- start:3526 stop:3684 length:159 start_codon:yes stop_codon:yes gene_type:complete